MNNCYKLAFALITVLFMVACSSEETDLNNKISEIGAALDELGRQDAFAGNWIIADQDTILLSRSYGLANVEKDEHISLNTRFNMASMNKIFTAATIMRLRDRGQLQLTDTVGHFLPDYPNSQVRSQVDIQQLLSHTSGLGDMFTPAFEEADPNTIRGLADYADKFATDSLYFAPGTKFGYSNAGYIVLGLIIEAVTGQSYYNFVREDLLLPLGMKNTGWYHGDSLYNTVATAYMQKDSTGQWQENPYLVMMGSSAGGAYTTVLDLLRYGRSLVAGEVVPASTLAEMTKDHSDNGYGYGLSLREINGQLVYGHNGGFPGVSGELDIYPDLGLYAVSLSNRSPRSGWASSRSVVRNTILGETQESQALLNANSIVSIYEAEGLEASLKATEQFGEVISSEQLFSAAERFQEGGHTQKAIDILTITTKVDPENWFAVSIKADYQIISGDTTRAIENWQKSLQLNPDNQWAKDRLSELGY